MRITSVSNDRLEAVKLLRELRVIAGIKQQDKDSDEQTTLNSIIYTLNGGGRRKLYSDDLIAKAELAIEKLRAEKNNS